MVKIKSSIPCDTAVSSAVERLRGGKCVVVPTETVYGLAADATNGKAVARIFEIKGRPEFNPLICHVDGIDMAMQYGEMDANAQKLAEAFWPGPLTIVVSLAENSRAHDLVTAGLGTIGLRCPQGISRKIITAFAKPLAAPSANRSGKISATNAQHVADAFAGEDLLVIDDGPCPVGLESTIVKSDQGLLTLLRPGAITREQLEKASGNRVDVARSDAEIQAPGMMVSHYAPDAKVKMNCTEREEGAGWLGFGKDRLPQKDPAFNLSEKGVLAEAASNLYAHLKALDKTGVQIICVAPIPEEGLGMAINDRLRRAAAPRPGK